MRPLPSQNELQQLLDYDWETGVLVWRYREGNHSFNNRDAGTWAFCTPTRNGYLCGRMGQRTYYAHRIAWKWFYGTDPKFIDHINHDRQDNRITNLRSVSKTDNCRNTSLSSRNKSGVVGVLWIKTRNKWRAEIKFSGKSRFLGYFTTIEEATKARRAAEQIYGFHENHGANCEA